MGKHDYHELYQILVWPVPIEVGCVVWLDHGLPFTLMQIHHFVRDPDYLPHIEYDFEFDDAVFRVEDIKLMEINGGWVRKNPMLIKSSHVSCS